MDKEKLHMYKEKQKKESLAKYKDKVVICRNEKEVEKRIEKYGKNKIEEAKKKSKIVIIIV